MQEQLESLMTDAPTAAVTRLLPDAVTIKYDGLVAGLKLIDAGVAKYSPTWELQQTLHADTVSGRIPGAVVLVEHPPVVTLGKNADPKHMKFHHDTFRAQGIDVVAIDRGGEVTAHEPGQLVMYPVLRLSDFDLMPKKYVNLLEEIVIVSLARLGIKSHVDPHFPGVWVGSSKVCALGIRIKDRATMHGIGLNVCNDLAVFDKITPCGIQGRDVTTVARLLGRDITVSEVAEVLIQEFEKCFEPRRASALGRLDDLLEGAAADTDLDAEEKSSCSKPISTQPVPGLMACCVSTIKLLALHNPMMVCSECKQIIKCFTSEAQFRNYLIYCKSSRRPYSTGQTGPYMVVVFKSYDTYHR
jgi:lipoate-protein ligase B